MSDANQPCISCIVPVFNGARFLAEAIDSILGQSLAPGEVIVVDDGSTDSTPEVAARYGGRVTYVRQDNAGPSAARNRGVLRSRGDFVAFLDADDLWHPDKLARQAEHFATRRKLDISLTHARNFWIDALRHEEDGFSGQRIGVLPAQTLVARRQVFDRVGLFDAGLMHREVPGWLALASSQGVVIETLPDVLTDRRIHESNRSRGKDAGHAVKLLALAEAMIRKRRAAGQESE
jgi:glycosyltransferase involved in cell wall biosynthesis